MSRKAASWPGAQLFLATDGGGGIMAVVHDSSLTGTGVTGDPLKVTNPFTAADETKLDGMEAGAEVNVQANLAETDSTADGFVQGKGILLSWKGAWAASTAYAVNDLVSNGGSLWIARVAIPSDNTAAPAEGASWWRGNSVESTEANAKNGGGNGSDRMSARRVKQAIDAQVPGEVAALFTPKDADQWQHYQGDHLHWTDNANVGDFVSFYTGAPAQSTLLQYGAGNPVDSSGIVRIRESLRARPSANQFETGFEATRARAVGDILYYHADAPYIGTKYLKLTVTAVGAVQRTGNARYRDLTVTTEQLGGNFYIGDASYLRITDDAPIGQVVPGNQVGVDNSFLRRLRDLTMWPAAMASGMATFIQANKALDPLSSGYTSLRTEFRDMLNDLFVRLDGSNFTDAYVTKLEDELLPEPEHTALTGWRWRGAWDSLNPPTIPNAGDIGEVNDGRLWLNPSTAQLPDVRRYIKQDHVFRVVKDANNWIRYEVQQQVPGAGSGNVRYFDFSHFDTETLTRTYFRTSKGTIAANDAVTLELSPAFVTNDRVEDTLDPDSTINVPTSKAVADYADAGDDEAHDHIGLVAELLNSFYEGWTSVFGANYADANSIVNNLPVDLSSDANATVPTTTNPVILRPNNSTWTDGPTGIVWGLDFLSGTARYVLGITSGGADQILYKRDGNSWTKLWEDGTYESGAASDPVFMDHWWDVSDGDVKVADALEARRHQWSIPGISASNMALYRRGTGDTDGRDVAAMIPNYGGGNIIDYSWNRFNLDLPLDIHDDISPRVSGHPDLANRVAVSAENKDGDPTEYMQLDDIERAIVPSIEADETYSSYTLVADVTALDAAGEVYYDSTDAVAGIYPKAADLSSMLARIRKGSVVTIEDSSGNTAELTVKAAGHYGSSLLMSADGSISVSGTAPTGTVSIEVATPTAAVLNFYDSGSQSVTGTETLNDTRAINGPSITEDAVITTEDIVGFGRVYKTAELKSLTFDWQFQATVGVGFRLRYSDTKPANGDDAKSIGTLAASSDNNAEEQVTLFDVPANRYFWMALSGGGSRTVNKRILQVSAAYEASEATAAGVSVDASGFDGNLATTDDTVQKVAEKLDKLPVKSGVHRRNATELTATSPASKPGQSFMTASYTPKAANARIWCRMSVAVGRTGDSDNDFLNVCARVKRGSGNYKDMRESADGFTEVSTRRAYQYVDGGAYTVERTFMLEPQDNTDEIKFNVCGYARDGATAQAATVYLNRVNTSAVGNTGPSEIEIYEMAEDGSMTYQTATTLDAA